MYDFFVSGQPIPHVDYTAEETATWTKVYTSLKALFKTHACSQFNHILPLLEQVCKLITSLLHDMI